MKMPDPPDRELEKRLADRLLDVLIRAGLVLALVLLCYKIFAPFLAMLAWALILAVTLYPLHQKLARRIGGKQGRAATLLVLVCAVAIVAPTVMLVNSLGDSLYTFATPLAQDMIQGLQFTDVAVADRLEQPPEGGVIRHPWPARQALQYLIAPQGDTLAEAARPADQANHHQQGAIDQAIDGIRAPLMTHLLTKQRAETEVAEKLDHRDQAPLAGEGRARLIQVDLRGCEPHRPAAFCAMFAHGKGDSSG